MARISTRSNPTDLIEIDRNRIGISLTVIDGYPCFRLDKFNLDGLKIPFDSSLVCVARAGNNTYQRFEMGTVSDWNRDNLKLDELDITSSIRFRLLVHVSADPQLIASAEKIRPLDESESESILPMEPDDLGQLIWRLDIGDDGPVLKFNRTVFPNAAGAENFQPFGALVLPEALRHILEFIADDPDRLDDENDVFHGWKDWLATMGITQLPTEDERLEWCNEVIERFCKKHRFATRLSQKISPDEF